MAVRGSGELKIEFYAHLSEIKDLYFNQGVVVFKLLHKKMVERHNLSLDYQAFCYYARRELKGKGEDKKILSSKNREAQSSVSFEDKTPKKERGEPIVARPSFPTQRPFNPHTVEIDEKDILK